jgi:hypothetical protein
MQMMRFDIHSLRWRRSWLVALSLSVLCSASPVAALTPGNEGGLFVVEDASAQFDALKHHAEAIAWRNPEDLGAPDPSILDHYQGLVRNPGLGPPLFYVSQLDDDDAGIAGGYVHIVRFASRTTTGERLRSNLQQIGNDTEEAYPPVGDTWVRSIRFDGTPVFDGVPLPAYKHPGSMALVDDVLFVPVDQPVSGTAPTGYLLMFDVANPTDPVPLQALPLSHSIDNVAVTRMNDGIYRLWTNGGGGNDINVYQTTHADLSDDALALILVQAWDDSTGLFGAGWPSGAGAHQSSTFVREPDGTLYLIGMRHPGGLPFAGSDFADLYRVDEAVAGQLTLTHVRTREFNCVYDGGGGPIDMRVCNMTASNNVYVTPTGELILYSIPHDDEDGFDPDIVRMGEFRHRDVNREGSPLRSPLANAAGPYEVDEGGMVTLAGSGSPPTDRPWVELYDDDGYLDRSIVVDYDDRTLLELNEFDALDGFGDKATAVRWRSPIGLDIRLFDDDDFGDRNIVLRGTGNTQAITHLDTQVVVPGLVEHFDPFKGTGETLGFSDKTSSLRWSGSPAAFDPPFLDWDLDGDGIFGETGAAASRGDETGATPSFDAASLDGPLDVIVTLRVTVSDVALVAEDTAVVHVLNLPPTVTLDSLDGGLPGIGLIGLPVTLVGSFYDAPGDTHTAEVRWGDGDTTLATVDAATSTVTAVHIYTTAGLFDVELAVIDDDGGVGTDSAPLAIYDPAGAVEVAIAEIDDLLAMALDVRDLERLQEARDRLDGNKGGIARNGALDKLGSGDLIAALVNLEAAIEALDEVSGVDVSALKRVLAAAANSIAQTTRNDAADFAGPMPSATQQQKLAQSDASLAEGLAKIAALEYAEAVRAFRFATARALEVLAL